MNRIKPAILVVDDDRAHRTMLKTLISSWGYDMSEADDGSEAISCVRQRAYDLILMDIRMVNVSGLEALEHIKSFNPAIPVVIMTAYSSVETAINALKSGAYDYLIKPLDFTKLKITINRAMEHAVLKNENLALRQSLASCFDRRNIVGNSPAMEKLLDTVAQVAPSEATILISGESGTGKELIAGALHYNSHRKSGPFIKINCAAITETLLESELFGHEKGAFTGATAQRRGKFDQANEGTLFLDEIGDMSLKTQAKVLRILQERKFERVGGNRTIEVDVRVIAATNKDLPSQISTGLFREDLYYRLNVIPFHVPPLRERRQDIPLLANHFLAFFCTKEGRETKTLDYEAMEAMTRYPWPGNVRELKNLIERLVIMVPTNVITRSQLPLSITSQQLSITATGDLASHESSLAAADTFRQAREEFEKEFILRKLEENDWNVSRTAEAIEMERSNLHRKIRGYGIEVKK